MTDRAAPLITMLPLPAAQLGESPLWHVGEQTLYWVDVTACQLLAWRPADHTMHTWQFAAPVGAVAIAHDGHLLVASRKAIFLLRLADGAEQSMPIVPIDADERFNDGACDRWGRFWVGTFDRTMKRAGGRLYCVSGTCIRCVDAGIGLSNGIGWSPDDSTMYFADTQARCIYAYAFDGPAGEVGRRRVFATFDGDGRPDGLTVDSAGRVWVCLAGGGEVVSIEPSGRVSRRLSLPVSRPSSCTFGGDGLATLYVTTMRHGLDGQASRRERDAGRIYAITGLGSTGLPAARYVA